MGWSRERLLAALSIGVVSALTATAGLGIALWHTVVGAAPDTNQGAQVVAVDSVALRDRIAAEPMASVDPQAAFTPDPATQQAATIRIPDAREGRGPAGVATGFPHTSEGAVGQLAAIEQSVLEAMSLPVTREIHAAWALTGAVGFDQWEMTTNVQAFLASGRQAGVAKDATTVVRATPVAGMVKGTDGPDWVVACVLMDVQTVIRAEARMGYGHCARMAWTGDRWQIAPGTPPAPAPSTWPGSVAAVEAGWLTWVTEGES